MISRLPPHCHTRNEISAIQTFAHLNHKEYTTSLLIHTSPLFLSSIASSPRSTSPPPPHPPTTRLHHSCWLCDFGFIPKQRTACKHLIFHQHVNDYQLVTWPQLKPSNNERWLRHNICIDLVTVICISSK